MVSWYSCSLLLNSDSVSSMRLPRLPSWESSESTDTGLIHHEQTSYAASATLSTQTIYSLDQQLRRCRHRGRWLCRSSRWCCTARCSLWSPPTTRESPRFPPKSDCRSRRRFRRSPAWQQRSYLSNVCAGQGEGGQGGQDSHQIQQRNLQRERC